MPWDVDTVVQSVQRTGRCVVSHEAPLTGGSGPRSPPRSLERVPVPLEAPVQRVCGMDTPFPLAFERYYVPDALRCLEADQGGHQVLTGLDGA